MLKNTNKNRIISAILVFFLIFSMAIIPVSAKDINKETESDAKKALKLINELVQLDMKLEGIQRENVNEGQTRSVYNLQQYAIYNRINEINDLLIELNVTTISANDSTRSVYADFPLPPSNSNIHFYSINDWASNGDQIYILIAAPITNSSHSANQKTSKINATSLMASGIQTLIQIYTDKVYSGFVETLIPGARWFPYELFPEFFPNSTSGQINNYEATLLTRTVTQFIYKKNSANQPVYYGSTSCVHVNTEEICRTYVGSALQTKTANTYNLIEATNYYDFGKEIVNANLSGYGVQLKHSFVTTVRVNFNSQTALTIYPVQYTQPIQAAW